MKINKKVIIGVVCALTLVMTIAVWGRQYYQDRYVSLDYYTVIPLDYDVTPVAIYALGGEDMGLGVKYDLTAYSADGETKRVEFTVFDPSSDFNHGETPPQPGMYLLVKASKQIVTGWKKITEDQIPAGALARINEK